MAIIQIRNAAGARGVEREEMPKRDLISKRAMHRILDNQHKNYTAMRHIYEGRLMKKVSELSWSHHNEKELMRRLNFQKQLTYYVGAASLLIGGGLGWLIP